MRLVEGHLGISHARPKCRPQSSVGRFCDWRQPRHPYVARIRASGRRRRARNAQAGRGQPVAGAGFRIDSGQWCDQAPGFEPQHQLRQGGGGRRQACGAGSEIDQTQGPEGLEDRRQAGGAARHAGHDHRSAGLRRRSEAARNAHGVDQGLPGVRRQDQELRCRQGHGHAGRQARAQGGRDGGRGGCRHLAAGQCRARRAADRLG